MYSPVTSVTPVTPVTPVVMLSSLKAIEEFRAASPDNFTHRCNMHKKGDIQKGLDNVQWTFCQMSFWLDSFE